MILVSDEEMVSYDYLVMGIFMVILGLIYDVSCVIIFLVDVIIQDLELVVEFIYDIVSCSFDSV